MYVVKCGTSSKNFKHLQQVHSLLITCGLSHLNFLLTNPKSQTPNNTVYIWNAIITAFSTSSRPHISIAFFSNMRRNGVLPNKHSFPLLLKTISRSKFQNPSQIFAQILKFGFDFDSYVQNSLVSCFSKYGQVQLARQVFDGIVRKDVISWTAMIDGYVRNNCSVEALQCFLKMRSMKVKLDEMTIVSVLCACGMAGDVWFGRWVHGFYIESKRVVWDMYIGSALIDMYSKCGHCEDASKVFHEMPYRNVVSWSAFLAGYVHCHRFKEALVVFQDMLLENVEPNQSTLTSVLTACAQLGALSLGWWVHRYIATKKLDVNSILGTTLIDMYAKCGCIHEAFSVFENMPVKEVYTWTAMINGLAIHGDALSSLSLFSRMVCNGVKPNEVTLIGVLSACSHGGFVDKGLKLFGSMSRIYNIEPNVDHYGCMVDLLGRAGRFGEAIKLIEEMPMEPSPGVWGALFGACMIHKVYELGETIGERLIKLQPHCSGRYALLANLYSRCRNWEAVADTRKLMREKGVGKTQGCSWVELNGGIYEFAAFENSHSESRDLYSMLDSVLHQLKLGTIYVPETNILLFDVD